ncbi:hypothetical protein BDV93DRAFT_293917 [Ceratobasidium sp. AG-I]|nr:hypothetical protein BDV93DRAFT_293917 [Ceratobasidium sp. AG-I]
MSAPMSSQTRIRMQAEQMRLDLANLPPPGTAPPRPRRPQTPVALNSPPMEDSPPVPSHQRSRFSIDSTGDETIGVPMTRERSNSIMSVKGIKKLWRGRNSTQNLNGKGGEMPPPIPASPNPSTLAFNRDSVLPQGVTPLGTQPLAPGHSRQSSSSQAQPAQVSAVKSGAVHKRDSSNSGKDPFRFDQDPKGQARSTSPSYLSDSTATGSMAAKEKEKATTRGILKKWSSKAKRADGETDSMPGSRPQSRQQNTLSPKKGPLNGLGGPTHSSRGSVSSVNTLTAGGLQADMPSRPSVSSSLASDAEPMTPRMSQFEMVSPPQNPS